MATRHSWSPPPFRDAISEVSEFVMALAFLASALLALAIAGFIVTARPGWVGAIILAGLGLGVLFVLHRQIHRGRVHPSR